MSTINKYTFSIKHKSGKLNQVADALSKRAHLLVTIRNECLAFNYIKDLYGKDEDFKTMWEKCRSLVHGTDDFLFQDGFFKKAIKFVFLKVLCFFTLFINYMEEDLEATLVKIKPLHLWRKYIIGLL